MTPNEQFEAVLLETLISICKGFGWGVGFWTGLFLVVWATRK